MIEYQILLAGSVSTPPIEQVRRHAKATYRERHFSYGSVKKI